MGTIKKKTLDKVLSDLNLTSEQVIEEALMDTIKNAAGRIFKKPATAAGPLKLTAPGAGTSLTAAPAKSGPAINPADPIKPLNLTAGSGKDQKFKTGSATEAPAQVVPTTQAQPAAGQPGDLKATTVQTIDQLKTLAGSLENQAAALPTINTQQASRLYQQLTSFLVNGIKKAQSAMIPGTAGVGPRAENLPAAPSGITQPDGTQLPADQAPQTNPQVAQPAQAVPVQPAGLPPKSFTPEEQAKLTAAANLNNSGLPKPLTPEEQAKLTAVTNSGIPQPINNIMSRVQQYMKINSKKTLDNTDWAVLAKEFNTTPQNAKVQYDQQVVLTKKAFTLPAKGTVVEKGGKKYTCAGQIWIGPDGRGIALTNPITKELNKLANSTTSVTAPVVAAPAPTPAAPLAVAPEPATVIPTPATAPTPSNPLTLAPETASRSYYQYGPLSFLNE